jgi:hypothetical protein
MGRSFLWVPGRTPHGRAGSERFDSDPEVVGGRGAYRTGQARPELDRGLLPRRDVHGTLHEERRVPPRIPSTGEPPTARRHPQAQARWRPNGRAHLRRCAVRSTSTKVADFSSTADELRGTPARSGDGGRGSCPTRDRGRERRATPSPCPAERRRTPGAISPMRNTPTLSRGRPSTGEPPSTEQIHASARAAAPSPSRTTPMTLAPSAQHERDALVAGVRRDRR